MAPASNSPYPIVPSQAAPPSLDNNYTITYANGNLVVTFYLHYEEKP